MPGGHCLLALLEAVVLLGLELGHVVVATVLPMPLINHDEVVVVDGVRLLVLLRVLNVLNLLRIHVVRGVLLEAGGLLLAVEARGRLPLVAALLPVLLHLLELRVGLVEPDRPALRRALLPHLPALQLLLQVRHVLHRLAAELLAEGLLLVPVHPIAGLEGLHPVGAVHVLELAAVQVPVQVQALGPVALHHFLAVLAVILVGPAWHPRAVDRRGGGLRVVERRRGLKRGVDVEPWRGEHLRLGVQLSRNKMLILMETLRSEMLGLVRSLI